MSGFLEVGLSANGKEVVVNHPDLQPDENGVGHIVFAPHEAMSLAMLLLAKADECNGREKLTPRPVDIVRHLCELDQNPRSPWGMMFAAHTIHNGRVRIAHLEAFVRKAREELQIVEREIGVPSEALKMLTPIPTPETVDGGQ